MGDQGLDERAVSCHSLADGRWRKQISAINNPDLKD